MFSHIRDDFRSRLRVETHHRFVEHPKFRVVNKRGDDTNLLFHTVRIRLDLSVYRVFEFEKFGIAVDTLGAHECRNFVKVGNVVDVFPARKAFVNGMVVGNVTHFHLGFYRLFHNVVTADGYRAAVKRQYAREALYSRGFAGAVLSEKAEDFARAQFKRYIVNRDSVALWKFFSSVLL